MQQWHELDSWWRTILRLRIVAFENAAGEHIQKLLKEAEGTAQDCALHGRV